MSIASFIFSCRVVAVPFLYQPEKFELGGGRVVDDHRCMKVIAFEHPFDFEVINQSEGIGRLKKHFGFRSGLFDEGLLIELVSDPIVNPLMTIPFLGAVHWSLDSSWLSLCSSHRIGRLF